MSKKYVFRKSVLVLFSNTDTIKGRNYLTNVGDNVMSVYLSKPESALLDNIKKLNRFSSFKENWDGYGAEPLPEELIASAGELIKKLLIQPEIFPTADGTIQFEYEKENGDYLEFQFTGNGTCEVFRRIHGIEEYFNAPDNCNSINAISEAFYG